MAQTLTAAVRAYSPEFDVQPVTGPNTSAELVGGQFQFADETTQTPVVDGGDGDFGANMLNFRAIVHLKTYVPGTAPSALTLEVADNAIMTVNLTRVALATVPEIALAPLCVVLSGVCPEAGKRYARVQFLPGGGGTAVFDALLGACP